MKQHSFTVHSLPSIGSVLSGVKAAVENMLTAGVIPEIVVRERKRSGPQNDKLQAMCHRLARIGDWHGDRLTNDEWRHLLVSGYKGAKVIPGLYGGFLSLIRSSKDLSEREASDVIEIAYALAAEKGWEI